jgi:hypothetical protein
MLPILHRPKHMRPPPQPLIPQNPKLLALQLHHIQAHQSRNPIIDIILQIHLNLHIQVFNSLSRVFLVKPMQAYNLIKLSYGDVGIIDQLCVCINKHRKFERIPWENLNNIIDVIFAVDRCFLLSDFCEIFNVKCKLFYVEFS